MIRSMPQLHISIQWTTGGFQIDGDPLHYFRKMTDLQRTSLDLPRGEVLKYILCRTRISERGHIGRLSDCHLLGIRGWLWTRWNRPGSGKIGSGDAPTSASRVDAVHATPHITGDIVSCRSQCRRTRTYSESFL